MRAKVLLTVVGKKKKKKVAIGVEDERKGESCGAAEGAVLWSPFGPFYRGQGAGKRWGAELTVLMADDL